MSFDKCSEINAKIGTVFVRNVNNWQKCARIIKGVKVRTLLRVCLGAGLSRLGMLSRAENKCSWKRSFKVWKTS